MRFFEDFAVGQTARFGDWLVDEDEMLEHSRKYDPRPFHIDRAAAAKTPYGGLIASGSWTISHWTRMCCEATADMAMLGVNAWNELRFPNPVRAGDRLEVRAEVVDIRESSRPDRGVVTQRHEVVNQKGEVVLSVLVPILMARRPSGASATATA